MAVPAKARSSKLYEQDLHAWSEEQAGLLRRRRFAELDLEHVVEEIEDVGGSLYRPPPPLPTVIYIYPRPPVLSGAIGRRLPARKALATA